MADWLDAREGRLVLHGVRLRGRPAMTVNKSKQKRKGGKDMFKVLKSIPQWPERIWRFYLRPLARRMAAWLRDRFQRRAKKLTAPLMLPRGYGKPVRIEYAGGGFREYISISEAARCEGVDRPIIQNALRNGRDMAGNIWIHAHPMAWTRGMQRKAFGG
jgi:hypothetical protein